jgi:hypothetical protein
LKAEVINKKLYLSYEDSVEKAKLYNFLIEISKGNGVLDVGTIDLSLNEVDGKPSPYIGLYLEVLGADQSKS